MAAAGSLRTMRVLAVDVGIRNLSFGIFTFQEHASGALRAKETQVEWLENTDFLKEGGCTATNSFKVPGPRLFSLLMDALELRNDLLAGGQILKTTGLSEVAQCYGVDAVVIERQPARGQKLASAAYVIHTYFETVFRQKQRAGGGGGDRPDVVIQHAGTKFMVHLDEAALSLTLTERAAGGRRTMENTGDHSANKKLAARLCNAFFRGVPDTPPMRQYWADKRQHDMADTFLLAAYYVLQEWGTKRRPTHTPAAAAAAATTAIIDTTVPATAPKKRSKRATAAATINYNFDGEDNIIDLTGGEPKRIKYSTAEAAVC